MTNNVKQICILGGGFGGLYTALSLNKWSWVKSGKCQVTLVEQRDHFLFTPLMYELLTNELEIWQIAPNYRQILAHTKINWCQDQVKGVNLERNLVYLEENKPLSYDYLVLAVGVTNRLLPIPGLSNYGLYFRNLSDIKRLEEKLRILELSERQRIRVAIVGAGPNGVELACKIADRLGKRGQVHLIDRGEQILELFSQGVQKASEKALKNRQIQLHFETTLEAITPQTIILVKNEQSWEFPVDLLLWTAGTQAYGWITRLAESSPQGKLLVKPTLQLIKYPHIFAVGDLAEIPVKNVPVPATAQAAYQQAPLIAKNIQALLQNKPLKNFNYYHLGDMLALGKNNAIISSFFLNWHGYIASFVRILAYLQRLPTIRHRLKVLKSIVLRRK